MKEIPLTQGKFALVDDSDYEWLSKIKWCFDGRYAARGQNGKHILMHREINQTPGGMDTDHINGNGLDNQRKNLRSCTHSQNRMNVARQVNNTSGYKGVTWFKRDSKWMAYIKVDGKQIHLGLFDTIEEASIAYQTAAMRLHGEFSKQWLDSQPLP